jgi:hypothetical protein
MPRDANNASRGGLFSLGRRRSIQLQVRANALQQSRADALDRQQRLGTAKRAVGLPVGNDGLSQHRPDAVDIRGQAVGVGGVDVDGLGLGQRTHRQPQPEQGVLDRVHPEQPPCFHENAPDEGHGVPL